VDLVLLDDGLLLFTGEHGVVPLTRRAAKWLYYISVSFPRDSPVYK
jgi:hypothetical protein